MEHSKKFVVRSRAVIVYKEELLVVNIKGTDFYALPGGHVEWEEDIQESLVREIEEELGVTPQVGRLLFVNNFIEDGDKQSIEFFFEILNSEDYLDVENLGGTHKHELSSICWAKKDEDKNILPKQIQEFLQEGELLSDVVRFVK